MAGTQQGKRQGPAGQCAAVGPELHQRVAEHLLADALSYLLGPLRRDHTVQSVFQFLLQPSDRMGLQRVQGAQRTKQLLGGCDRSDLLHIPRWRAVHLGQPDSRSDVFLANSQQDTRIRGAHEYLACGLTADARARPAIFGLIEHVVTRIGKCFCNQRGKMNGHGKDALTGWSLWSSSQTFLASLPRCSCRSWMVELLQVE